MAARSWNQKVLCDELVRLRTERNLSHREVAALIGRSNAWVSRAENGLTQIKAQMVREILEAYEVEESEIERLCELARDTLVDVWWRRHERWLNPSFVEYLTYEHEASSVTTVHAMFVPGLLQAEEYLRYVLTNGPVQDPDRSDVDISVRMRRQQRLYGANRLKVRALLGMPVLYWQFGGPAVLLAQMEHLLKLMAEPNIEVQLVSYEKPGPVWSLDLFESANDGPAVAFSETQWGNPIHEDPLEVRQARRSLDRLAALALSEEETARVIAGRVDELRAGLKS